MRQYVCHYKGKGPFLLTKPEDADKFGTLTIVVATNMAAVQEGDHLAAPVPDIPANATQVDGLAPVIIDDNGAKGPERWVFPAWVKVTAWGNTNTTVIQAIWQPRGWPGNPG